MSYYNDEKEKSAIITRGNIYRESRTWMQALAVLSALAIAGSFFPVFPLFSFLAISVASGFTVHFAECYGYLRFKRGDESQLFTTVATGLLQSIPVATVAFVFYTLSENTNAEHSPKVFFFWMAVVYTCVIVGGNFLISYVEGRGWDRSGFWSPKETKRHRTIVAPLQVLALVAMFCLIAPGDKATPEENTQREEIHGVLNEATVVRVGHYYQRRVTFSLEKPSTLLGTSEVVLDVETTRIEGVPISQWENKGNSRITGKRLLMVISEENCLKKAMEWGQLGYKRVCSSNRITLHQE